MTDKVQCIGFSLPMFAALVCLIILVMFYCRSNDRTQKRLSIIMMLTYVMAVCCWFGIILYVVDYNGFVWFKTPFFFALMFDQVLLYRFVFSITGTGSGRKFRRIHYLIPVALTVAMGVWSLLTPYGVQYGIVETRGDVAPGYVWYSRFYSATVPVFIIYNILYPLLGLFRVRAYRRAVVNYSADEQRASAGWLYSLIFLIWLTLPVASGVLFVHKSVFFASALTVPGAFLPIFQYLFICYNLLSGNYVIIQPPEQEENGELNRKPQRIDRKKFEAYIREQKPYLNPKLRITDMCTDLGTNRSYLSSFINREYDMNFSRYVNLQRLEELDRLRIAPENKTASGSEMVPDAGFSSYRSYLRAKYEEDARRTVLF
jgi:AraC-like DNA-binding protein